MPSPIFSSKLRFPSPRIKYLTRSLPNLDTVQLVDTTEDERIRDEAQEALVEHYDNQVKQFYLDRKERVGTGEIEMSRPQEIRDRSVDMNTNFCGISEENKCNHRREGNRPDTPKRSISGNRDEGRYGGTDPVAVRNGKQPQKYPHLDPGHH